MVSGGTCVTITGPRVFKVRHISGQNVVGTDLITAYGDCCNVSINSVLLSLDLAVSATAKYTVHYNPKAEKFLEEAALHCYSELFRT